MPAETEIISTVRGDIKPSELGRTNVHEHSLMRSPLLRGDELDDVERSTVEAIEMQNAGIDALVELMPIGLSRGSRGVAKIAERSRLQVVLATGIHQQAHYSPEHWIHRISTDQLEGCDSADYGGPREQLTNIRAGVIKVGAGYWRILPLERRVFEAAGKAHRHNWRTDRLSLGNGHRGLGSVGYSEGSGRAAKRSWAHAPGRATCRRAALRLLGKASPPGSRQVLRRQASVRT